MKVCRVCQSYNDKLTQLSTHLYPLTVEQIKLGLDIQVVVNKEKSGQNHNYIHTFINEKRGINKIFPFSSLYYGNEAFKLMKNLDYDIVHGHQGVCFGLVFKNLKAPFIYTAHNAVAIPSEVKGSLKEKYSNYLQTLFLTKKAKIVTGVSDYVRDRLIKYYKVSPEKVYSIPAGFYPELFKPIKVSKKEKIVLFVGRMTKDKGIQALLKTLPIVLKKEKNVMYYFVGLEKGQDLYDYLINFNNPNVKIINSVSHKELVKYYNLCDVYVLASRLEAAGKTTLEAMGCGKPVILSEQTGFTDLVRENNCGLIVPYNNHIKLADAIIKILSDEYLSKKMGKNARKISLNYSWKEIGKRYIPLYESLIKT